MAITIVDHLYVRYNGNIVEDIGLSDTLNNITTEDLMKFIYCGGYNRGIRAFIPNTVNATLADLNYVPFDFMMMPSTHTFIFDKGTTNPPAGAYMGIIWLYTANSFGNYPDDNASRYRVVCKWDAPNYYITLPAPNGTHSGATSWSDADNNKCYTTGGNSIGSLTYMYKEGGNTHNISVGYVQPYMMYLLDSEKLIFTKMRMDINNFRFRQWGGTPDQPTQIASAGAITHSFRQSGDSYDIFGSSVDSFDLGLPYSWAIGYGSQVSGNPASWGSCIENMIFYASGGGNHYSVKSSAMFSFYLNTRHESLLFWANCGIKFYAGTTLYKPIIIDGIVTGYSDDMDTESDLDDWNGTTNHSIPLTPPVPPTPDDDEYDDMGIGTGGNVGGLSTYAIMTLSDLADLIADFNSNLEAGQSVVNNFICCYKLGPLSSFVCTTGSHNIIMSAYSTTGNNFVSQRADYAVISSQKDKVSLGSYSVPRMTNTFYDFSPYTTYELFIPCCGWIPLPDTVAGRTIDVYLLVDVASCSCKGIVRIGGTTIAEVSGVIGSSVPFYINDSGLARSAIIQGIAQTMSSLIVGGVSAGSGNSMGASMGVTNALQSAQQVAIAGNTNYTAVRGTNGDMTAYGNGEYCTIKIMHPVIDSVVNNSEFGHTIGYLCNEIGALSSFHGFTVCSNPHVNISASSRERDEIKQLLEQGVILP